MKKEKGEIWKDVIDYQKIYNVSNLGRIKSLKFNKEKILKPSIDGGGYLMVGLSKDGKLKSRKIHQLVAEAFLGHIPCGMKLVINHINFNKLDNRVSNLEIVTARENANFKHIESISNYTGISICKKTNKWRAVIHNNYKNIHLGYFSTEVEASKYYENALFAIKNNTIIKKTL